MNPKNARWVWLLVILQVGFLLAWAGYHEWVRQSAPTVLLKTLPVDPRDILRGDYMTLNYEISRPGRGYGRFEHAGEEVYVVLKRSGRYHVIDEIRLAEPAPEEPRVWVRANVWGAEDNPRLDYGIERFFVPEGKGTPTFKTMDVEASVSATHQLYIRRVWLDGKRFP